MANNKICSIEDFNKILESLDHFADINVSIRGISAILKVNDLTICCNLTGENSNPCLASSVAKSLRKFINKEWFLDLNKDLRELYGYKEVPVINDRFKTKIFWDLKDPGNFQYSNQIYSNKEYICYSYDANSAYSFAMINKMPDTRIPARINDRIGENEIGFYNNGGCSLVQGQYATYVFKLVESPYIDYVDHFYNLKSNAKTKPERVHYKFYLNIASGLIHRYNIFHRLAILYYSRDYIQKYSDKDTIYSNTDSIVSLKPRDNLPIGNDLGQFKIEHNGDRFKFIQPGIYQWESECHYTGIPSCCLTDIEDTKDWFKNIPYIYDTNSRRIIKNEKK